MAPLRRSALLPALPVTLASVAGFVDVVGYIVLLRLFTAHMSGNTVKLGRELGAGDLRAALPLACTVALFLFGIGAATAAIEIATRRGVRSTAALMLGFQAALLVAFVVYGERVLRHGHVVDHTGSGFYPLAGLLVVSMGVQTATLQRLGGRTVRTTYISGTLTNLTVEAVNYLFWLHDRPRRGGDSHLAKTLGLSKPEESLGRVGFLAGVVAGYLLGAVGGSYLDARFGLPAMTAPLVVLAALVALDLRRPIHPPAREGGSS